MSFPVSAVVVALASPFGTGDGGWMVARSTGGILAFLHENTESIHTKMESSEVHIMHHAGRLRMALHGYNTKEDVEKFLEVLKKALI